MTDQAAASAGERPFRQGIPESAFDSSIPFLREGYTFISRRCDALGTDAVRTRIMLTPVICMRGREAAEIFYGGERFGRRGAMPKSVLRLLQDEGSVQSLEGAAHRLRKQMFMSMMTPASLERAVAIFADECGKAGEEWARQEEVVLHRAVRTVLTRTTLIWAGVPADEVDAAEREREIGAMIDRAGSFGPANWWARRLRNRSEAWAQRIVHRARTGEIVPPGDSALAIIARHEDEAGAPLGPDVAAVELLNVLRPTVAVDRFVVFAALALYERSGWRQSFASGDDEDIEPFVQEVRRYYPFFPVVGGKARTAFEWHGHRFDVGQWVLLDLYGTNRHPGIWNEPGTFRPERFRGWPGDPFALIPQGAGAFETDHRCPGEWLTIALVKEAVRFLCRDIRYDVPRQNLDVSLTTIPTLPASGFVMTNIRPAG